MLFLIHTISDGSFYSKISIKFSSKDIHIYKYSMTACFLPCIKALTIDMSAI